MQLESAVPFRIIRDRAAGQPKPFRNLAQAKRCACRVAREPRLITTEDGGWLAVGEPAITGQVLVWGQDGMSCLADMIDSGVLRTETMKVEFVAMSYEETIKAAVNRETSKIRGCTLGRIWIRPDIQRSVSAVCELSGPAATQGWAEVAESSDPDVGWRVIVAKPPNARGDIGSNMAVAFHLAAIDALASAGAGFGYKDIADRIDMDRSNYRSSVRASKPASVRQVLSWIDHWNETRDVGVGPLGLDWTITAQPKTENELCQD